MNDWLEKLHDIEGLDAISAWPPHPLFWLLLFVLVLCVSFLIYRLRKQLAFKRSWKYDALHKLTLLEKDLPQEGPAQALIQLSEYIRRIAIQRFKREECAALCGEDWLKWLKRKDPRAFDWEKKGRPLIEAPYAPNEHFSLEADGEQVKELIKATKEWVR